MKTIYLVLDGIAVGSHEIDPDKDLLSEIQRAHPKAISVDPFENVHVIKTNDSAKVLADREEERKEESRRQAQRAR